MTIDQLKSYGLTEMTDTEVDNFLSNRGFGVLALPTDGAPYVIPMSFGYDGENRLYFSFFVGEDSRKRELSERAETASFLVFKAESVFSWESVLMTGELAPLSSDEFDAHADALGNAWHLSLFDRADTDGELVGYQLTVSERRGVKSMELPPGFDDDYDREFGH